ncbi:MAG: glycosyl hydrolase [Calditrichaeota bacterium]|nr:glycosyl hydrolase [Calditrichota bacterium]
MLSSKRIVLLFLICLISVSGFAKTGSDLPKSINELKFRLVGPALVGGRVSDIAVDPGNRSRFFVAVASGGVWRTLNAGTTFEPVFDNYGSYSIGCITIDPSNPLTVWVGSGENNSQRSVSYGDGVYKSIDGGTSWTNVGLKESEHIGNIIVDPRNSDVVYVAAQGPLWKGGGDRGLYKTTDGGKSWKKILETDKYTGCNEVHFDPRNPDILYATTYQRMRHTWTLINGGPGSALYKSTDAGKSWRKITSGLPAVEMGRIGLDVSPANPDVVYAIIEARSGSQGFYRSADAGENWVKMNNYVSGSPQYYNEIVADPQDVDLVYSLDTWTMVTHDGGKSWDKLVSYYKHVDNHAWWIDPDDTNYMLTGCDGGLYETYDKGKTWKFFANLPICQFYRATPDNDFPFYNVYGGTQDNFSLGAPARNISANGITNRDWFITLGGDGFKTQIDPENPDILYAQSQNGGLNRFDKKSGEIISIQPQPLKDQALRWNWDSPLIISPHNNQRLYYAANILFRSDDRGQSWQAVSPDLTRQIDRNKLKVMDQIWSIDAVAKNKSTSFFGNIVSVSESPIQENLVYAGTDDGLIQITENGGSSWTKYEKFPGVPEMSYVSDIEASLFAAQTVYATFDNHKMGDFKPYILKSSDKGKSWKSISGNLPEKGTVYTIVQDHKKEGLLFAGTEFGVFVTTNEGENWTPLKGGLPLICVRDLEIQRREDDLVAGTFGRGIYILDDYSPLRNIDAKTLQQDAYIFPVKKAWMYMPSVPLGLPDKAFQGDGFFVAENPEFGAIFTYFLKDSLKSLKEQRVEREKSQKDDFYPSWDALRMEKRENGPQIILTVRDADNQVVRRINAPKTAGLHRVSWDLRYPSSDPVDLSTPAEDNQFGSPAIGPMIALGKFTVTLEKMQDNEFEVLTPAQNFECIPLNNATLAAADLKEVLAFQQKSARLQRAVFGAMEVVQFAHKRIDHLKKGLFDTANDSKGLMTQLNLLANRLEDIDNKLNGDDIIRGSSEPVAPAISSRISEIIYGHWTSTSQVTKTHRETYKIAAEEFGPVLAELKTFLNNLEQLEAQAELIGTPITPGRVPDWKME